MVREELIDALNLLEYRTQRFKKLVADPNAQQVMLELEVKLLESAAEGVDKAYRKEN